MQKLLNWTAGHFTDRGLDEPLLSAQLLLAKALNCSKVDLYLRFAETIEASARSVYRELVRRAGNGEPIAYLTGTKEFFSLSFAVGPGVLIPRPETELLVQWVVREVRGQERGDTALRILDLGTGSGCIAISLAKHIPQATWIAATDISVDALVVAQENCRRHRVRDVVNLVAGDLFEPLVEGRHFDFIVANLPYVTEADYQALPKQIKDYEPPQALLGGDDGGRYLRRVIERADRYLRKGGCLVLEIGYNQSDAVGEWLGRKGYERIEFERDHAGIKRVAIGCVGEIN